MAGAASGLFIADEAVALGAGPEIFEADGVHGSDPEGSADEAPELDHAAALRQLAGLAVVPGGAVNLHDRIAQLRAQQATIHEERKRVQRELRNEERKRRRLVEKARSLSTEDLVTILGARAAAKAKAKAKAKAAA